MPENGSRSQCQPMTVQRWFHYNGRCQWYSCFLQRISIIRIAWFLTLTVPVPRAVGWSATGSMINVDDLVNDHLNSGRGKVCPLIPERLMSTGIIAGKEPRFWSLDDRVMEMQWMTGHVCILISRKPHRLLEVAFQFDIYVPEEWVQYRLHTGESYNNSSFTGYGSQWIYKTSASGYYIPWIQNGAVKSF